jgi:hypothetical protein
VVERLLFSVRRESLLLLTEVANMHAHQPASLELEVVLEPSDGHSSWYVIRPCVFSRSVSFFTLQSSLLSFIAAGFATVPGGLLLRSLATGGVVNGLQIAMLVLSLCGGVFGVCFVFFKPALFSGCSFAFSVS